MEFYLAPLEGITGHMMRSTYHEYFASADKYYIPFLTPSYTRKFGSKEINEVLPEHNKGMHTVPQILTNRAEDFIWCAKWLQEYGYEEVNFNLGCPSKTVVSKNRGSGFLSELDELERFFDDVFRETKVKISVKTRLGRFDAEEFEEIMELYNCYPFEEIIIHPRVQKQFYLGKPDLDAFGKALETCRHPVCYNGDIFSLEDYKKFTDRFPQVDRIMLGRGILRNPGLISLLREGENMDKSVLRAYHDTLYNRYRQVLYGEKNVLFKMKEFWVYLGESFQDNKKYIKKIKKAEKLWIYEEAVNKLFEECELIEK